MKRFLHLILANFILAITAISAQGQTIVLSDQIIVGGEVLKTPQTAIGTHTFTSDKIKEGTVTYNHATKELIFNKAKVDYPSLFSTRTGYAPVISINTEGVIVKFVGTNTLTGNGVVLAIISNDVQIVGDGSSQATLNSAMSSGIVSRGLTIRDANLDITGKTSGMSGYVNADQKLTIERSALNIKSGSGTTLKDYSELELKECFFASPSDAKFNASLRGVVGTDNQLLTTPLSIEKYNLQIGGQVITTSGILTLPSENLLQGTVTYNASEKEVVLNNAHIYYQRVRKVGTEYVYTGTGIYSNIPDLTITLLGQNKVHGGSTGLSFANATQIHGRGSLEVTSQGTGVSLNKDTDLHIDKTTLLVNASTLNYGIRGSEGSTLHIQSSNVKARGSKGAICEIGKSIHLDNSTINAPKGAQLSTNNTSVVDQNGNIITEEVDIVVNNEYKLKIAGTTVTTANVAQLATFPGVTVKSGGYLTFDPTTNTLKMRLVEITPTNPNESAIYSEIEDLTIYAGDRSYLNATDAPALYLKGNTIIKKTEAYEYASIVAKSPNNACISFEKNLTIDEVFVGNEGKIGLRGGQKLILLGKDGRLEAANSQEASVINLEAYEGYIYSPDEVGVRFDPVLKAIVDKNGNITNKNLHLGSYLDFSIDVAGVYINTLTMNDLTAIPGVTVEKGGYAKYDPNTRTLHLKNTRINADYCLFISERFVTLHLEGENVFDNKEVERAALDSEPYLVIEGNGKLTLTADDSAPLILEYGGLIKDCTLEVVSLRRGMEIYGPLTIENADIKTWGDMEGSFYADVEPIFNKCHISNTGVTYDATKKAFVDRAGNICTEEIHIVRNPEGISNLEIAPAQEGIYNLSGVRIHQSLDHLPAGLYIVNGQKVMKK